MYCRGKGTTIRREVKLLDVVALLEDVQAEGVLLQRGEVGAVVEILAPEVYEVESRLGRLTVLGNVLCWHQDPQNVLTAVALGEQLFDELEQTLQRVTSYRMHLLSDGDGALCERKPFCFRP